ncbi:Putative cyclic-di-GMP phosphodiesterase AdrB [Pandoraea terrae]|uniref:cyclic-guanylate-specific phosphodiesterase n=1 Tax=Pandoraea terrae TaxID=1537710 RepID=A0A5E4TE26_9BURK|nr:EAL domain-containing protein [Pandoraea terrae]VVD86185.1 Putative cyclic-di-GMP phosphodiesterase AdrB [Pandoraea terrae]
MIQHSRVVQWLVTGLVVAITLVAVLVVGWMRVYHLSQFVLQDAAQRQRAALERIVDQAQQTLQGATGWVGRPCGEVSPSLQAIGTLAPYFRSIYLVSRGQLYCSSVVREPQQIDTVLPADIVPMLTGVRTLLVPGTPMAHDQAALALYVPTSATGGVLGFVDGIYLTETLRGIKSRDLAWTAITVGNLALTSEAPQLQSAASATRGAQIVLSSERFSASLAPSTTLLRRIAWTQAPVFLTFGALIASLLGLLVYRHLGPEQYTRRQIADGIRRDEFKVYYQPVMSLADGRCTGAEALVRWHHPEHGLIRPDAFIPVAESNGLIIDLTRALLHQIRNDVATGSLPPGFRLGINLAERHLRDTTIVQDILRIYGPLRDTYPLVAEITERYVIRDTSTARHVLSELRRHGIDTALDDFGTENNSIGYLKHYDFDYLKIDKEFLPVTEDDALTRNILDSIIDLGMRLGLMIVAEGVENAMQAEYLRSRGVQYAQGYLFCRPVAFDELVHFAIQHANAALVAVKTDVKPKRRAS